MAPHLYCTCPRANVLFTCHVWSGIDQQVGAYEILRDTYKQRSLLCNHSETSLSRWCHMNNTNSERFREHSLLFTLKRKCIQNRLQVIISWKCTRNIKYLNSGISRRKHDGVIVLQYQSCISSVISIVSAKSVFILPIFQGSLIFRLCWKLHDMYIAYWAHVPVHMHCTTSK